MSDQRGRPACPHCARKDVTIRYLERRIDELRRGQKKRGSSRGPKGDRRPMRGVDALYEWGDDAER